MSVHSDKYHKLKKLTDSKIIEKLNSGYLVSNIENDNLYEVFIFNSKEGTCERISLKKLKYVIKDFDKKYTVNYLPFRFRPDLDSGIISYGDDFIFNTYQSASWRRIEKPDYIELIEIYSDFLDHLTANDLDSKEYILDWLAVSLKPDLYLPFLTLIGNRGVGKGILSEIVGALHGASNYTLLTQRVFNSQFNDQLKDKTFAYLDEIKLDTHHQHNKLKLLINRDMEIEGKNVSAQTVRNYCKVMIASNNQNAISISQADRRFSIPELSDLDLVNNTELMLKYGSANAYHAALLDPHNISSLGYFLEERYKNISRDMTKHFVSNNSVSVFAATLSSWEDFLFKKLLEITPEDSSESFAITDIQNMIMSEFPKLRQPPGRVKLQEFCDKFSRNAKWHIKEGVQTLTFRSTKK